MAIKAFAAGAMAALALALASCGSQPQPDASETAVSEPEAPPGITLSDARVQLPLVSGRPGAAYFSVSQANGAPRKVVGVAVEMAARAEMHETKGGSMAPVSEVPIGPGKTVKFAPGGYHVMLFDLDPKLRFTKDVELTVTFDGGDKASTRAPVTTMQETMEMSH
ncbi:copper chaperone PCu(A)C [Novosphingobium sp. Gsoil 351]|uniref:copper chaperone PCu(A)C n=1 Tax=Novosphingobium sp. Gsoil 351 TaxID=2675225 RepID=UPI0012B4723C|nr:copper chaperone PCu(A)C [Novosphingobium sp. Gsoil 351]QGN53317.1 copper chaperone PCu(A)C [Novosphingobium sp. Gsoil 351]